MLTGLGVALEIVGLLVTGEGARRIWREFAPPGERFFDPIVQPVRAIWRALSDLAIRAYRRVRGKGPSVVVGAGLANGVVMAFNARARVQFRTLPGDLDPAEALKELDERTRRLMTMVSDDREKAEDGLAALRQEIADMGEAAGEVAEELERKTRRVAVGGIRLEALGLTLVALGVLLQGLGAMS